MNHGRMARRRVLALGAGGIACLGLGPQNLIGERKAMAQGSIYNQFLRQCTMLAYLDVIKVLAIAMLLLIPLVFFMRRPPKHKGGAPMGH